MNSEQILNLPSMPAASPSYPLGPYRFINREFMIISYETDRELLREAVPEPLEPNPEGQVLYEWIRMPDSSGFGDYTESGIVIPCLFKGEPVNYTAQMYLDDEPPISAGREIWGFPKKYAEPKLESMFGHADRDAALRRSDGCHGNNGLTSTARTRRRCSSGRWHG